MTLIGRKSNRSAFGARVKVVAGDLTQIDERRSGGSYLSQNDTRLHFGLGRRQKADRVEVRWPDGAVETLTDVAANRFITVTEGERRPAERARATMAPPAAVARVTPK